MPCYYPPQRNNYTWNRVANVIFLESPADVGFSYSRDPSWDYTVGEGKGGWDDGW